MLFLLYLGPFFDGPFFMLLWGRGISHKICAAVIGIIDRIHTEFGEDHYANSRAEILAPGVGHRSQKQIAIALARVAKSAAHTLEANK